MADYRLKVQLNETSSSIASDERLLLVRETSHRMRRGVGSVDESSAAEEKEAVAVEEKSASTLKTSPAHDATTTLSPFPSDSSEF